MTKKYHRRRNLKGGFLGSLGQTFSNLGSSISQGTSSFWNKTKKATGMGNTTSTTPSYTPTSSSSSYMPSNTSTTSTAPTASTSSTSSIYSYGGKRSRKGTRKTKRSRTMKRGGNFSANTPIDSLASRAGNFPGTLTARVHDLVGGKRKRRSRSRRSRR
jgi:hypothetical protein